MSQQPLRVAHLITGLDTGGAEVMLARLVTSLDPARVASTVISMTDIGVVGQRLISAGIPVRALGMRRGRVSVGALRKLVASLRRSRPDVLQTWLYHADLAGLIAGSLAGVRSLAWNVRCSTLDMRDHSALLRATVRVLATLSRVPAVVVSNSIAGKDAHEAIGYRPRRWCVIPNGLDVDRFRPSAAARSALRREIGAPDEGPLVGMLARLHPMKDHANFMNAAAAVACRRPDVHFVLAGRDVDTAPDLRGRAGDGVFGGRMHLLGERADAASFLSALDAAVLSSYSEAFPTVVLEAMACGTPSVVTDVGDAASILGGTGIVVPPRNPDALADGVLRLLEMAPSAREALGLRARARAVAHYPIDRVASQYVELWTDIAARRTETESPHKVA